MAAKKKTVKKKVAKKAAKKPDKKKKNAGRPKFEPDEKSVEIAYECGKKGLSDKETAKVLGIAYTTFKKNKDHFAPSIKKGREDSQDARLERVENSLLKKAEGFFVEETETEEIGELQGATFKELSIVSRKTKRKFIQPSDTAIIFYLVNKSNGAYKSINRPDMGSGANDRGAIVDAIEDMKNNPV